MDRRVNTPSHGRQSTRFHIILGICHGLLLGRVRRISSLRSGQECHFFRRQARRRSTHCGSRFRCLKCSARFLRVIGLRCASWTTNRLPAGIRLERLAAGLAAINDLDRKKGARKKIWSRAYARMPATGIRRNGDHRKAGWTFADPSSQVEFRTKALTANDTIKRDILHRQKRVDTRVSTASNRGQAERRPQYRGGAAQPDDGYLPTLGFIARTSSGHRTGPASVYRTAIF